MAKAAEAAGPLLTVVVAVMTIGAPLGSTPIGIVMTNGCPVYVGSTIVVVRAERMVVKKCSLLNECHEICGLCLPGTVTMRVWSAMAARPMAAHVRMAANLILLL